MIAFRKENYIRKFRDLVIFHHTVFEQQGNIVEDETFYDDV